ncbi:hypothetical protein L210DRAFT_3508621 [Boletus edulis BED1]|uniref:Uncharacterized protein n=1 Tax=Boletus edulis BED1 TaxID=1328754 RepID=A0AAD4BG66_BOLED|nr:hypothetical protein L210DRAFT_3508621 [Boletus edulis BED1]
MAKQTSLREWGFGACPHHCYSAWRVSAGDWQIEGRPPPKHGFQAPAATGTRLYGAQVALSRKAAKRCGTSRAAPSSCMGRLYNRTKAEYAEVARVYRAMQGMETPFHPLKRNTNARTASEPSPNPVPAEPNGHPSRTSAPSPIPPSEFDPSEIGSQNVQKDGADEARVNMIKGCIKSVDCVHAWHDLRPPEEETGTGQRVLEKKVETVTKDEKDKEVRSQKPRKQS